MCKNHTDLEASEVRELPAEARRMDRPVRMPAPRPEDVWPALASLAAKPKAVEMRPESVKCLPLSQELKEPLNFC